MSNSYVELPYGVNNSGISLSYGDTVPSGAVNLAYVQTKVPSVIDVVAIEDDLSDINRYAGNTIPANVLNLQIVNGQVIDPLTSNLYVGLTDNMLFTTVTFTYTDLTNSDITVPLFYNQHLRFPISLNALPTNLSFALSNGIPVNASTYVNPSLSTLIDIVNVTTESGAALPSGFLWQVLPSTLVNGQLYLSLYTNFSGTYKQSFKVTWGGYSETLNVHPIYFQHLSTPTSNAYVANTIQDNISGVIVSTNQITSGSSTASLISGGGQGITKQPRSSIVTNASSATITSTITSTLTTNNIAQTTDTPFYISSANGYVVYPSTPSSYATSSTISAPTSIKTALTLTLTQVSCQADNNGYGQLSVTLYDSSGIPVKSYPPINAPTVLSYQDPHASSGAYTWSIRGTVNDSLGIENSIGAGQYNYTCTWTGSYSWFVPLSTTYVNNSSNKSPYITPTSTVAPINTLTALSLNITSLNVPTDPYGTSYYIVQLVDPGGVIQYTWGSITSAQVLTYPFPNLPGESLSGSWTWLINASCSNNNTGTSTYNCSMIATQNWYVSVPGAANLYNNQDGAKASYTFNTGVVAPTSPNTAVSLTLNSVNVQSDPNGKSTLKIQLIDPNGRIANTWANISQPQVFTYSNLSASIGIWTWNVWTTCTNTGLSLSTYNSNWTGSYSFYKQDPTVASTSSAYRTIGFTYSISIANGTIYATTDDGPQIFVQEPDNLSSEDNWYLRIHRGWLSYTDNKANTYLVGIEPYYSQNFNTYIPIVTIRSQKALVVDSTSVRVPNIPILVDQDYPIDIVVTRRTTNGLLDIWITRDNSMSSGNYVPSSIMDINASQGVLQFSNFYLHSNDTVHCTYSYLQYYLLYRGFFDTFNRFIHLDINPTGGHTFMNLWNIINRPNTLNATGTSVSSITNALRNVATLLPHSNLINASGTATIVQATQSITSNVLFSSKVNNTSTPSITAGTKNVINNLNTQISGSSIGSISATPYTVSTPTYTPQTINYSEQPALYQIPHADTALTPQSASVSIGSTPQIVGNTTNVVSRYTVPYTSWHTFMNVSTYEGSNSTQPYYRQTASFGPPAVVPFQVDIAPNTAANAITYTISGISSGGHNQDGSSYPWVTTGVNPVGAGSFDYRVELYAPNGQLVYERQFSSETNVSDTVIKAGMAPSALVGTWNLHISPNLMSGNMIWTSNTPIGAPRYDLYGVVSLTALKNTSNTTYSPSAGAPTNLSTHSNTVAPTNPSTGIILSMTSVNTPNNSVGASSFNISLTAPNGVNVYNYTGLVSVNGYVNWYTPGAQAGVYTWTIWATCTSNNNGASSYPCSSNISYSWNDINPITTYTYSIANAPVQSYSINVSIAPTNTTTQLSCTIANYSFFSSGSNFGYVIINLLDPYGQVIASQNFDSAFGQLGAFVYSNPSAVPGQYTWQITGTIYCPAPIAQSYYPISANFVLSGYDMINSTHYTYNGVNGVMSQYPLDVSTIAPINTQSAISLTLSSLTIPSDGYGSSSMTVQLLNPNGVVILQTAGITSTNNTYTYNTPSAIAGRYVWQLYSVVSIQNNGTSSYNCTYNGTITSQNLTILPTYTAVNPTVSTYPTASNTITPTSSATALSFVIDTINLSNDLYGSTQYTITLLNPNSISVLSTVTASTTTLYYYNASAITGIYTWYITPIVIPQNNGASSYNTTLAGRISWYQSVTTNSQYYKETNGTIQNYPVVLTIAPSSTASYLSMVVKSIVAPFDTYGHSSFAITLLSPTSAILATWNVSNPQVITWYSPSAIVGTYTWQVAATTTNANTGNSTYNCSMSGLVGWYQIDQVPTMFYYTNTGPTFTYSTNLYTISPHTQDQSLTATFTNLIAPSNSFGYGYLDVVLTDVHSNPVQEWSNVNTNQVLNFVNPTSSSGPYTWSITGKANTNNTGSATYINQWAVTFGWVEAVDDEASTNLLVQRSLYMYLTEDGYPFHAVLDPSDDASSPFSYDTNNALAGSRYSSINTIHSF